MSGVRLQGDRARPRRSGHLVQLRPVDPLHPGLGQKPPRTWTTSTPPASWRRATTSCFSGVARMIMMGIENTGKLPFHTVYLHGLVLDPEGVKMSKTRATSSIRWSSSTSTAADGVRYALTTGNSAGNNMRLNEQKLEASRNFANKLWNAARFVITKPRQGRWDGRLVPAGAGHPRRGPLDSQPVEPGYWPGQRLHGGVPVRRGAEGSSTTSSGASTATGISRWPSSVCARAMAQDLLRSPSWPMCWKSVLRLLHPFMPIHHRRGLADPGRETSRRPAATPGHRGPRRTPRSTPHSSTRPPRRTSGR